jgi:acyl carrier protein
MSERTAAQLLEDLGDVFRNFHGREYSGPIGRDTWFFADLGLASIDAVVLGETLEERYGKKLPFGELMADLGSRSSRDIRIGELVDFLEKHLNSH